jgi:hypothetical protein
MTRYVVATALLVSLAPAAGAQPVPINPPPGTVSAPGPIVIPITSAKPPSGFYKSGGVLVGADGYYPFDTGPYLLGGYEGLTRYSGSFVMVPPGGAHAAPAGPELAAPVYAAPYSGHRGRLFHRR